MANIAISELNTEVTIPSNDDLLLISKKDGTTYTSAKIKKSNLVGTGDVKFVDSDIYCYISPTGSDSNFSNQLSNFGTSNQQNYPLYSINAAVKFICRFRLLARHHFHIVMAPGSYTYTESQDITHPDCNSSNDANSCYIIVGSTNPANPATINCSIHHTFNSGSVNLLIQNIIFNGDASKKGTDADYSALGIAGIITLYNVKIQNYNRAIYVSGGGILNCCVKSKKTEDSSFNVDTMENYYYPGLYITNCVRGIEMVEHSVLNFKYNYRNFMKIDTDGVCIQSTDHGLLNIDGPLSTSYSRFDFRTKSTNTKSFFNISSKSIFLMYPENGRYNFAFKDGTMTERKFFCDTGKTCIVKNGESVVGTVTIPYSIDMYTNEDVVKINADKF